MKKRRILTIGHSYVVRSNRSIVRRLAKRDDIDMTIASPAFFHGDLRSLVAEPPLDQSYRLAKLPAHLTGKIHFFFYRQLKPLFEQRFDLVHAWEEPYIVSGFQIAHAAHQYKTPYFFRTANSLPKNYPFPFSYFEKYCVKECRGWVAGASLVHKALCERGYPKKNAEIITLAADENLFQPNSEQRKAIQQKLELDPTIPIIGYIGRLSEEKGFDILLPALEKLKGPWQFLALGSGPYKEKIESWASQHGFSKRKGAEKDL